MSVGAAPKARQIHKDLRPLVDAALKAGWTFGITGKNHWRLLCPSGRGIVYVPGSPSTNRAQANLRADLRRAGLSV